MSVRRGRVRFAIAVGLVLTVTSSVADEKVGSLKGELALAKRAGLPATPADMKTSPLAPEENAATYYLRLQLWMRQHPYQPSDPTEGSLMGRTRPDVAAMAKGRKRLAGQTQALKLIHAATDLSACDFQKNWAQGPAIIFPEYARMRSATRLLMDESAALLWDGKPIEAVNNMARGFRIARHANMGSTIIAHLVAVAIDAITLRGLENILYSNGGRPEVAAAVLQAVERNWAPRSLRQALRGEAVIYVAALDMVRRDGVAGLHDLHVKGYQNLPADRAKRPPTYAETRLLNEIVDANGALLISHLRRLYAVADRPYPDARQHAPPYPQALEDTQDPKRALAGMMLPDTKPVLAKRAMDEAKAAVVRSAAATLVWKGRHGKLPDKLDQVMHPAPIDPFDGKPLRYRRLGDGFLVWSVGDSGKFGGLTGSLKEYSRQAVFRWPMPGKLKKTPPPSRPAGRGAP